MDAFREWMGRNWPWLLAVVTIAAAVVIPLVVYRWQKQSKRLVYLVGQVTRLVNPAGAVAEKLHIMYDGETVNDPYLITVRIINVGKLPIQATEYDTPIVISLGGRTPVSAAIGATSSEFYVEAPGLWGDPSESEDLSYSVKPRLLNRGDWFDVQLLSDGAPTSISVSARIVGQTRPMEPFKPASERPLHLVAARLVPFDGAPYMQLIKRQIERFGR